MKHFLKISFSIIFFSLLSISQINEAFSQTESKQTQNEKIPVLVELFTSEGCPTCPPADRLLQKLESEQSFINTEVITLSLHVDYWNRSDWKDPFSSSLFTRRQDIYARAFRQRDTYTPQMIVDGRTFFIGSNAAEATKAIVANAKNEKANIEISNENNKLKVMISKILPRENSTVFLAITEDISATGKKSERASVVRELRTLGMLTPAQNEFKYEQAVQINPDWKKENLKFVVFIQENQSRKILGVNRIKTE
jgi:hypothetical protein